MLLIPTYVYITYADVPAKLPQIHYQGKDIVFTGKWIYSMSPKHSINNPHKYVRVTND